MTHRIGTGRLVWAAAALALPRHTLPALAAAVALAIVGAGCGPGDCEEENCGDLCSAIGSSAPDASKGFQDCVQNAGSTGGDLVLVGDDGEEQFRCRDEHDELGNEVGTCTSDFVDAKAAYCGC